MAQTKFFTDIRQRKYFLSIVLLIFSLFLHGCLIYETEEVKIVFSNHDSGSFEITIGPIGSDKIKKAERDQDFSYLLYDIIENDTPLVFGIENIKGELTETHTNVFGKIRGRFTNLELLQNKLDILIGQDRFVLHISNNEELLFTDGKISKGADGRISLSWPRESTSIHYKVRLKGETFQPVYSPAYTFFPEYRAHLKDINKYKVTYIKNKLNDGFKALKKKSNSIAYKAFNDVLRVDPNNRKAQKEKERISFTPYRTAAEAIPLPFINISIGFNFNTKNFNKNKFVDAGTKHNQLKHSLDGAEKAEKAHIYCQMSRLTNRRKENNQTRRKFRNKAIMYYDEIKNKEALSPDNRFCHSLLLMNSGGKSTALQYFKEIAFDHPRYWTVYKEIIRGYSNEKGYESNEIVTSWINRADYILQEYLDTNMDITESIKAEEAYDIFIYIISRNFFFINAKNLNTIGNNPVNKQAYRMIRHAAMLEPDNPVYRSALGYSQLVILSANFFKFFDPNISDVNQAVINALDKLNQNMEDLIAQAQKNLNHTKPSLTYSSALEIQNRAYLAFLKKDFELAEKLYIMSIKASPERDEGYLMLTAFYNIVFSKAREIRKDKRKVLLHLLNRKIKASPKTLDHFLIGKLELQVKKYKKAMDQFILAVSKDFTHYPSVVGMFKSMLLVPSLKPELLIKEIDMFLQKDLDWKSTDELVFAKGVAYAIMGKKQKALEILKRLYDRTKILPLSGLKKAIISLTGV